MDMRVFACANVIAKDVEIIISNIINYDFKR